MLSEEGRLFASKPPVLEGRKMDVLRRRGRGRRWKKSEKMGLACITHLNSCIFQSISEILLMKKALGSRFIHPELKINVP